MTREVMKQFLKDQIELNEKIAGPNWIEGRNENTDKPINYPRAIYMETAELIDSYPWKHWKHTEIDNDNIKIEIVDIWHFILSWLYQSYALLSQEANNGEIDKEAIIEKCVDIYMAIEPIYPESEIEDGIVPNSFEDLLIIAANGSRYENPNKEFVTNFIKEVIDGESSIEEYMQTLDITLGIFKYIIQNVVPLDLEKLYNGKRILNEFRKNHGYQEGTYNKVWYVDGETVEDNVVMIRYIEEKELYQKLEELYNYSEEKRGTKKKVAEILKKP